MQRCIWYEIAISRQVQRCILYENTISGQVQRCMKVEIAISGKVQRCVKVEIAISVRVQGCMKVEIAISTFSQRCTCLETRLSCRKRTACFYYFQFTNVQKVILTICFGLSCFLYKSPPKVILNLFQDLTASLYYIMAINESFTADRC